MLLAIRSQSLLKGDYPPLKSAWYNHRISARAERKVVKALLEYLRKVHGKTTILYRIAEAAIGNPDGIVREVLYPVVGERTLCDLVLEFKATEPAYQKTVLCRGMATIRDKLGHCLRLEEWLSEYRAGLPAEQDDALTQTRAETSASTGPNSGLVAQ
jgi:hypothetical protein